MNDTETRLRENVRTALNQYAGYLSLRKDTVRGDERDHALASYTQVASAKRVLWLEDSV